jgi:hypothetical protein
VGFLANGNHSEEDVTLVWNRAGPVDPGYHPSHCIYRVWPSVQQLIRLAAGGPPCAAKIGSPGYAECNFELHAHDHLLDLRNLSQSSYC